MILRKTPAREKRAKPPRASDYAAKFLKDWERLSHSGRFDMRRLKTAMLLLIANEGSLPAEYRDHALLGEMKDHRECHIGGDFLLVYHLRGDAIVFVRAGTHADLFGC
ncbi:type II toxin-antitoxin system YafQ family toxin [Roseateles amylovorans]|uniref:Type II toxin-antitoxin system YafQ family toxin n=1 Tax=Roseateles amylovorans TaxID=2978473 RepID=A0ABY6B3Y5_9BURK|nr:type II toxin-antitoxin system YafQ family toxin [Roseateles amylovorans]UXH78679.1 type II toxin-antitoxin system YafQ family toxin [Roseateles amylovorans]